MNFKNTPTATNRTIAGFVNACTKIGATLPQQLYRETIVYIGLSACFAS